MTRDRKMAVWAMGFVAFGIAVHLLSSILLPFVAGMAIAYFLDPIADRLEARKMSRTLATSIILLAFFLFAVGLLMLLVPLLHGQITELVRLFPRMVETAKEVLAPLLEQVRADLPAEALENLRQSAGEYAGKLVAWITRFLAGLWSGGLAFFNMLSLLVITPVVAFYLLRDWDHIIDKLDSWLPRPAAPTIREQCRAIDDTIAAFVRGQATVCIFLALFYGVGLSLMGLKSGLLVGLGAGMISFIPYLGAASGMAVGVGIALFQFDGWISTSLVAGIFLVGQTLESYVLTPRMVGDRVGLHPVWIIFALMAGGALFGFTGVLLAVPVTAIIGVLVRFSVDRYLESPLYTGDPGAETPEDPGS